MTSVAETIERPDSGTTPFLVVALWAVVAVLPHIGFYVAHFLQEGVSLGFVLADLPYYSANGREIFERGNGLMYPNPYDPSPDAPVIYFQWLICLLGVGVVKFGFDPGIQFVFIGFMAAFASAFLSFRIVESVLPSRRFKATLYLLTMWGGGLFVLFTVAANLGSGQPVMHDLTRHMPFDGWWFLNWGINLILPTEAVYHALVALTWLMLIRNRSWTAVGTVTLLATTHPFAGLQHLAGVGCWLGFDFLRRRNRSTLMPTLAIAGILAVFLYYYMIYLPSFESHSSLQADWSLSWGLKNRTLVLAYGPILVPAIYRIIVDRDWLNPKISIFAVSFACSLLLAKHELWTNPRQPIHFARGYIWMPLCLIALPAIQRNLVTVWDCGSGFRRVSVITTLILASITDNVGWMFSEWPHHSGSQKVSSIERRHPFVLTDDQWEVIQFLGKTTEGYVLCTDAEISYLLPTYSPLNVYVGHFANTPNLEQRRANVVTWAKTGHHDGWFNDITYVVLDAKHRTIQLSNDWRNVYSNSEYFVYRRIRPNRKPQPIFQDEL